MNKPKVVVTRTQFENEMERLRAVSDLVVIDSPNPPSKEELKEKISGATALFAHINDSVNGEIMDAAGPSLKVIAEFGVGYDNIDVEAANERDIAVANTPGVLTETTASFAFTLMQSAARRIEYSQSESITGISSKFMIRYVKTRWLSLEKVLIKVIEQWPNLKEYFLKTFICS